VPATTDSFSPPIRPIYCSENTTNEPGRRHAKLLLSGSKSMIFLFCSSKQFIAPKAEQEPTASQPRIGWMQV
jgi:hypothetical protein